MKTMKLVVSIVDEEGVVLSTEDTPITWLDVQAIVDGNPEASVELFEPTYEACEKALSNKK